MKHWTRSRTIWLHIVTLAADAAILIPYIADLGMNGRDTAITIIALNGIAKVAAMYLRTVTTKELK